MFFCVDIFWSMLFKIQALSTAHPWGIQTHTELQLPIKISPEAKSLLREVRSVLLKHFTCFVQWNLDITNLFTTKSSV